MVTEIEKARQIFKSLEMKNFKSKQENAIRLLCIQELLNDTRETIKVEQKLRG